MIKTGNFHLLVVVVSSDDCSVTICVEFNESALPDLRDLTCSILVQFSKQFLTNDDTAGSFV